MSIKTLRKRIALVAVSALGVGLLSVAPASAGDGDMAVATTAATFTTGVVGSAVTTDNAQTIKITTAGTVGLTLDAAAGAYVSLSGPCVFDRVTSGSDATLNSGATILTTPATTNAAAVIRPTAAGICVASAYDSASATSTSDKLTITVVASTSVGKLDASESFARLNTTNGGSASTYTDVSGASTRTNGQFGYIDWSINDSNGQNMPSTTVVTASATNGALVSFTSGAAAISSSATTTGTDGTVFIAQPVTDAPVSTVVTLSVNGTVWTSKSLTITGDITSIKVVKYTVGRYVSTVDGTGTLLAYGYDSAGNQVARTISAVGSLYDSVVSSTSGTITTSATTYATGTYTCANRGAAKVQYYIVNTALKTVLSNVVDVQCAGDPYTYTASLDKATYAPGEIATLTITAKDSKGNLTNGTATLGTAGTYAVTISGGQMTAVTTPTTVDTFTDADGVKVYKFTVGTTEGSYQMIVDLPKWTVAGNGAGDAVTVAYKVSSGTTGVSNAEVLAAIVKLIASINKQIRALQKSLKR